VGARAKTCDTHIVSFTRLYPGIFFPGATQFDRSAEALLPPVEPEPLLDSVNPLTWRQAGLRLRALAPDILVVPWWHPFFGPSLGTAARIARRGGRPKRIFLTHNVEPHESTPIDRWLAAYGLGAADGFLVHAKAEAERLKSRARGRPVRVHPHPTYEFFSERRPTREAARAAIGARGRVILFFGYVRPYKGLADLLEALRLARSDAWDQLYVVGEFYEPRARYEAALQDPALRGKVTVVDRYLPNEESTHFAAADVTCTGTDPRRGSRRSPRGGRTVIDKDGGLEEVVEEEPRLPAPSDPRGLARAIEKFFGRTLARGSRRCRRSAEPVHRCAQGRALP
jgi:glycosyltransferase involved in cell wall biosynthesis